ncbi:unnamed protein product, partial [marine sediment metagenome]
KVLNEAQKMVRKGELKYESLKDVISINEFWELMRKEEWSKLRNTIDSGIDVRYMMKKLFDKVYEDLSPELAVQVLGEY